MAGHEVYAASALSVVAAVLLARWCMAGRSGRPRTAAVSRRASPWTALRQVRRTGPAAAQVEQRLPADAPCAQQAVQEAENLVHGYWSQIGPLYLSKRDHHQR
ncbi:hypothetical protein O1Q96_25275 [Streptomyces sp. Qhu-G9]|uniref:hypothetical protein n=1 Tax=Streptomyces sp. Qhu-G9 TaxID=3452799 RepID=UPI0022AC1503|nr:hypothetical protein [Streptomyces aurantiacus]WAU82724.1 hypothetical protein O1Q96_25275 [Streptomyces aurantiacus]